MHGVSEYLLNAAPPIALTAGAEDMLDRISDLKHAQVSPLCLIQTLSSKVRNDEQLCTRFRQVAIRCLQQSDEQAMRIAMISLWSEKTDLSILGQLPELPAKMTSSRPPHYAVYGRGGSSLDTAVFSL